MVSLDASLIITDDFDILSLNFPRGLRENALLWLIGIYVELVEMEAVRKGNKLSLASVIGLFKQKKQLTRYRAVPELGIIVGLDTESTGIG